MKNSSRILSDEALREVIAAAIQVAAGQDGAWALLATAEIAITVAVGKEIREAGDKIINAKVVALGVLKGG